MSGACGGTPCDSPGGGGGGATDDSGAIGTSAGACPGDRWDVAVDGM